MTTPYYTDDHVTLHVGDWRELIPPDCGAFPLVVLELGHKIQRPRSASTPRGLPTDQALMRAIKWT